jgi:methionine sulfoxide reductase catalytic subunit
MLIKRKANILTSEITDRAVFESRRRFIKAAAAGSAALMLPTLAEAENGIYGGGRYVSADYWLTRKYY